MYVLIEQANAHATSSHHVAAVRGLLAADQTKDRGLAGAVATNKPGVLTGIYLQRSATQDILRAV